MATAHEARPTDEKHERFDGSRGPRTVGPSDGRFVEHWDELNLLEVMHRLGAVSAKGYSTVEI